MSAPLLRRHGVIDRADVRTLALVLIAACAMTLGVATYAFLRPRAAAFLPVGWHQPLSHGLSAATLGALPTFVHALAMPLLTAALANARRGAAMATICTSWFAAETVFELAQHPAVGLPLLAGLPSLLDGTAALARLSGFVRGGTFDPLDIAAAALASLVACAVLIRMNGPGTRAMEVSHV